MESVLMGGHRPCFALQWGLAGLTHPQATRRPCQQKKTTGPEHLPSPLSGVGGGAQDLLPAAIRVTGAWGGRGGWRGPTRRWRRPGPRGSGAPGAAGCGRPAPRPEGGVAGGITLCGGVGALGEKGAGQDQSHQPPKKNPRTCMRDSRARAQTIHHRGCPADRGQSLHHGGGRGLRPQGH